MKEVSREVDFLHGVEHESLLRIDPMILMEMVGQAFPKLPTFAMILQYLEKGSLK